MEPVISTSFIPKRPVSTEPLVSSSHSGNSIGLLSLITVVIVIGTAAAFAGVYIYQKTLTAQESSLQGSLSQAQNGLGSDFVTQMQRLSQRISGVKSLIQNHVVVSPIFAALQATTLQSVSYKTFTYRFTNNATTNAKMVEVDVTGTAKDYATLALQSDAFAQNNLIKNPVFSNLTVNDQTSGVDFKLIFTVDPTSLSYLAFINSMTPAQAAVSSVPSAVPVMVTPVVTPPTH
jgi:hypothetical protein